jgi:hypothetical protein
MKLSANDRMLSFEQEFLALLLVIVLAFVFSSVMDVLFFYLAVLAIGFVLYFWMVHEEEIFRTGKKHIYFEHTSSYLMVAQTALALELLAMNFTQVSASPWISFLAFVCMIISVIMYSVSLSRIFLFKLVFKSQSSHAGN